MNNPKYRWIGLGAIMFPWFLIFAACLALFGCSAREISFQEMLKAWERDETQYRPTSTPFCDIFENRLLTRFGTVEFQETCI